MPLETLRFRPIVPRLVAASVVVAALVIAPGGSVAADDVRSAESAISPREEFLAIAEQIRSGPNPWVGRGELPTLLEAINQPNLSTDERARIREKLALEHLRLGDLDEALQQIDTAISELESARSLASGDADLFRTRALVHLRRAEVANCITRHNRDCCIFPLQGGAIHSVREPAEKAKEDLLAYLNLVPKPAPDLTTMQSTLIAIWLLNIVCMALDEYPDGVPAAYLIPPGTFESEADIGRFIDVAPKLGVDSFDHAGGVIVDDFDRDGLLDIVSSTCDVGGPLKAFRNVGDGTFENVATTWKLDEQLGGLNIIANDYNNDGRLDILVLRGAWMFETGEIRRSLLRQNEDGSFTDVTREAGLLLPIAPTQTALWADFDNDGRLDLYIGHESQSETAQKGERYLSVLFRNNGDGTFTDITATAGVGNDRYCKGVAAGDYDNDGDVDIYVSNIGVNRLYRNNGDLTFTDLAVEAGVTHPEMRSFATWFFDYDNDGWLDIWVGAYDVILSALPAHAMGLKDRAARPCVYRNNRDGTFTNLALSMGLDRPMFPMGANYGDFDNDGWLDIYLGTGDPQYEALMPNIALRNHAAQRFQDITKSSGLGHLQKGHGIAFADIDNDGDQDLYHQLGAFFPGDAFRNALFANPGHGNHFLAIDLLGVQTNRMAYGARIKIVLETPSGVRELHRAPGCVSSFGGSPRRQEIGLGDASAINSIEVWWPKSGVRQTFADVAMDQFIRITEGKAEIEVLRPARMDFGATQ